MGSYKLSRGIYISGIVCFLAMVEASGATGMKDYTQEELLAVRDRHEAWLLAQPGVIGTGIGLTEDGRLVIKVFTKGIRHSNREAIAKKLTDVPIAWEEGEVVAY